MADSMVERVARALWADADDQDFGLIGPETQKRMRRRAGVAIAAMREPSEAMQRAYDDASAGNSELYRKAWAAAVDAALAE